MADSNVNEIEHDDVDNESDLQTPPGSEDDEADNRKFPKYKIPENGDPVMMELGTEFDTKQQVKDAIKELAMEKKKNIRLTKNDATRMVAKCLPGCTYHMRITPTSAKKHKKTTKPKKTNTYKSRPSMQTGSSVQVAVVVTQSSQAPKTQGSQANV
ncbi:hypothetical protein TSUD_00020 [Trifolium subterraneum]|nr:hypothetical protein TSUD_00020 [Trifolium subterraneum]